MRKRVYVAGPYTKGDPCVNTHVAIAVGNQLLDAGFAPFVPHLLHFWHTLSPRPYEDWMALDLSWVVVSEAVLRLPGESKGADMEVECAHKHSIPVFTNIDELIGYFIAQKIIHAEVVL